MSFLSIHRNGQTLLYGKYPRAKLGLGAIQIPSLETPEGYKAKTPEAERIVRRIIERAKQEAALAKASQTQSAVPAIQQAGIFASIPNWMLIGMGVTAGIALLTGKSPFGISKRPRRRRRRR